MSLSTTQQFGTATPVTSANTADSLASLDKTDSLTIILTIIGVILTLASVIVAVMQYRIQAQRRLDVERDGQPIEMNPQRPAREAEGTAAATPS